jgi:RNA polymerase sigma factor (sigma-70 family)
MTANATAMSVVEERAGSIGAVYEENVHLLVGTAVRRYRIPESEAQGLAHDVFVSYLMKSHQIEDSRAWLLSAICNASKFFLRRQQRHVELPPAFVEQPDPSLERIGDALPDQLAAREAVCCLTARCQLALRLRYFEGYTVPEVALELGTTAKHAANVVARCLRQAHTRYAKGNS